MHSNIRNPILQRLILNILLISTGNDLLQIFYTLEIYGKETLGQKEEII